MANRKSDEKVKIIAQTYIESGFNKLETYKKVNPTHKENVAKSNAYKLLHDPRVQEEVNRILAEVKPIEVTKEKLVTILGTIIGRYYQGKESGSNLLRAVELLAKLVPDFASKSEIHSYQHMSEEDLEKEIKAKHEKLFGRN